MVYCELVGPNNDDYGKKIIRISPNLTKLLNIKENDIIEVIVKSKRMGAIVKMDPSLLEYDSITPEDANLLYEEEDSDDKGPKPDGLDYAGNVVISSDNLDYFRLDGELRKSLKISIGDIVEIDTTLSPPIASTLYINLFETDPSTLSFEEKQIFLNKLNSKLNNKPISAGSITAVSIGFKEENVLIQATIPDGITIVNKNTIIEIQDLVINKKNYINKINYDNIGGLKQGIHFFRRMVELPIRRPELFKALNIRPPKGILVSGPSGVGKSLLIEALANETGISLTRLPPNLFSGVGLTETNIRNFFDELIEDSKYGTILLLMDNLDTLTPAPYTNQPEFEKRFTIQFALTMEKLKSYNNIVTLGTCSSVEMVHPMMRRVGRFDVEIELDMPNEEERQEILKIFLRNIPTDDDITDIDVRSYVNQMYGFSGADIALFVKEAGLNAINRNANIFLNYKQVPPSLLIGVKITKIDFDSALKLVEPSGLKTIHTGGEKPNLSWDDIGGLKLVKQVLKENIEWQFSHPEVFNEMGIDMPQGLLLYGPPGTGKTLLAKAIASQIKASFLPVKGPELLSMWFGDSARLIRELFQRARKLSPSIIFFDEIDALAPRRGSDNSDVGKEVDATVNQLLTLLDGIDSLQGVFVIGATNRPGAIDQALLRPGRLDRLIHVSIPDEDDRLDILAIHTKNIPIENKNELIKLIAQKTHNYSGADLENLCREAVIASLRENFNQRIVTNKHFMEALKIGSPSVDEKLINYYNNFTATSKGEIKSNKSTLDYH